MAKTVHDDVLDGALNITKTGTRICVCNAEPTTYLEATDTYELAIVTIDPDDFVGPADGDASGRKITTVQQSGVAVDDNGTASHVAICIAATEKLLLVTTCTEQVLTAGNTVTIPAFKQEIADPT